MSRFPLAPVQYVLLERVPARFRLCRWATRKIALLPTAELKIHPTDKKKTLDSFQLHTNNTTTEFAVCTQAHPITGCYQGERKGGKHQRYDMCVIETFCSINLGAITMIGAQVTND